MKYLLLVLLCLGMSAEAQVKKWIPVGKTPYRGAYTNIALDPQGRIYVSTPDQVFYSDDGGLSWTELEGPYESIGDIAVHPLDPGALLVAMGPDIFRTRDTGRTWQSKELHYKRDSHSPDPDVHIHSIRTFPVSKKIFVNDFVLDDSLNATQLVSLSLSQSSLPIRLDNFILLESGAMLARAYSRYGFAVYRSLDTGRNWKPVGQSSGMPVADGLQIFVHDSSVIMQADFIQKGRITQRRMMISRDKGETWLPFIYSSFGLLGELVDIMAVRGDTVYARAADSAGVALAAGLYRSTDMMKSWEPLHPGLEKTGINEIAFTGEGDLVIAASTGLYFYDAGSKTLTKRNVKLLSDDPQQLFVMDIPVQGGKIRQRILAADNSGLVFSEDSGSTWSLVTTQGRQIRPGYIIYTGNRLLMYPGDRNWPDAQLLYLSTDYGRNWYAQEMQILGVAQDSLSIHSLQVDDMKNLFVEFSRAGLRLFAYSTNQGESWEAPDFTQSAIMSGFTLLKLYVAGGGIYARGTQNGRIVMYRSFDRGATWERFYLPFAPDQAEMAIGDLYADRKGAIYIRGGIGSNMYRWREGWAMLNFPPSEMHQLWFDSLNGMYRTLIWGQFPWKGAWYYPAESGAPVLYEEGLPPIDASTFIYSIAFSAGNVPYASLRDGSIYYLGIEEEQPNGVRETGTEAGFSAAPNPFTDGVTISFEAPGPSLAKLSLCTVLGEEVFTREVSVREGENSFRIPAAVFAPGMYRFLIRGENFILGGTLVKQ